MRRTEPNQMRPQFQRHFTENSKKMNSWMHMKIEDIHRNLKEIGQVTKGFTRFHSEGTDHVGFSLKIQRAKPSP